MAKRFAPATERNRSPLLEVLREVLPDQGLVLEVASGTGQHAAFFSGQLPSLSWQPSDCAPDALESIEAWVAEECLGNLRPPVTLDVFDSPWPILEADAVLCINMIHISPWEATEALFAGAASLLDEGGPLVTYGPYSLHGRHTAPSNAAFDQSLRSRNPRWGVRDVDALEELGARAGFRLDRRIDMPANNMSLVWRRLSRSVQRSPDAGTASRSTR